MPQISVYVTDADMEWLNKTCKDNSCGLSNLIQALIRGDLKWEEAPAVKSTANAQDDEVTIDGEKIEE